VVHVPEGMDDTQISLAVADALSEFYDGPWVFDIDLP